MKETKQVSLSSTERISIHILEPFILIYLTICVLCFALCSTSPFTHLLNIVHLSTTLRPFLRNIGLVLCIAELVFSINLRKGAGRFLLYGIIAAGAISSWQQRVYGSSSNLNSLLWMAIFFVLFYSAIFHFNRRNLRLWAAGTFTLVLIVWCTACCLSLVQFALQIGSNGPNHSESPWLRGTGFSNSRLTGVFGYPEYGAVFGVMVIMLSIYYIIYLRLHILRIFILLCNFPIFIYIVLSGSRNALVALYSAVWIGTFLFCRKNWTITANKGTLASLLLAFLMIAVVHCLYAGTKIVAENTSGHFHSSITESSEAVLSCPKRAQLAVPEDKGTNCSSRQIRLIVPSASKTASRTMALHSNPKDARMEGILLPVTVRSKKVFSSCPIPGNSAADTTGQQNQTPRKLDRQYVGGDTSNGRFRIWKDYLSIRHDFGFFGLSPENASFYIQEHYPDLYICTYIRKVFPDRYEKGYVFHTHNGYLRVFVACGYIGLICMLLFFLRCILTVVSHIHISRKLSAEFTISLLVVVVGISSALFDNEIFFNLNPTSLVFWIALSILNRVSMTKKHPYTKIT